MSLCEATQVLHEEEALPRWRLPRDLMHGRTAEYFRRYLDTYLGEQGTLRYGTARHGKVNGLDLCLLGSLLSGVHQGAFLSSCSRLRADKPGR